MKLDKKPKRILRSTKRQLLGVLADDERMLFLSRIKKYGPDKFQLLESENGFSLKPLDGEVKFLTLEGKACDLSGLEEVRMAKQVEGYIATLVIKKKKKRELVIALSSDLKEWIVNDTEQKVTGPGVNDTFIRQYKRE